MSFEITVTLMLNPQKVRQTHVPKAPISSPICNRRHHLLAETRQDIQQMTDCPAVLFVTDNPNEQRMEASAWEDGLVSSTPFLTIASPRLELIEAILGVIGYIRDEAEDTKASWIYRLHNKESAHD